MPGDDMSDVERPQPIHRVGDIAFHDTSEVQSAHHGVDGSAREDGPDVRAHVDDSRVGAGAEHDQTQASDLRHEHALVQQQGVWLPGGVGALSTEVIVAALLEGCDPRYLPAVVEVAVEQQTFLRVVDDCRTAPRHLRWDRNVRHRDELAAAQADGALVEHSGIDVDRYSPTLLDDLVDRRRERGHVIPVAVRDRDRFDFTQTYPEGLAVTQEDGPFRSRVEEQRVALLPNTRNQSQPKAQIRAQQRLAGDDAGSFRSDLVDRRRERGHVIPVAVRDRDRFDFTQTYPEGLAVTQEDGPFRSRVEEQRVALLPNTRNQSQPKAQIRAQQRLAGDDAGSFTDDVGEFRHGKRSLADVVVADIVREHGNAQGIQRREAVRERSAFGHRATPCEPLNAPENLPKRGVPSSHRFVLA